MAQGLERIPLAVDSDFKADPVRANFPDASAQNFKLVSFEPDQAPEQAAPASMGVGDTLSSLGRNVWDAVVYHTPAAVAAAVEGDDPYATSDWKDALINRARQRAQEVSKPGDANTKTAIPGITAQDINSLGPSAGFSAAGAAAGLGAGIPAGMVASPVAGYAAGMAASGTAAYRMATNQFVRDLHDTVNAESLKTTGKPISPQEFQAKQAQLADTIKAYGLWEAVPEAAGNALSFGILTAPVKGAIGKLFGKNIATRFAGKLGALYGEELATETATQMGQHNAEVDAGMTKAPRREFTSPTDWRDSFKEVAGPTMLQTTLMAGGFKAGQMAKDRLMGKAGGDQPDNAIPAGDIGAGPGGGGVEGEFIPAGPSPELTNQRNGATYTQAQPELPAGQAMLPRPALPAPEDGGPSERQVSTAIGLLKHSPRASPELLQRLMRVDQTMATMLFNHWQGQTNGQVAGNEVAEIPAPGDQGQGADIAGSRVVGGFSDGAVSFTPDTAAEVAAPGGEPGMALGAAGTDAVTPLDVQAHAAATSPLNATPQPTEAQKAAGNYAKGHVRFQGMDISIENPAGSVRAGKDSAGREWQNQMQHHYGYIKGTIGKDKDHLDVFIKPGAQTARTAYVVDQIDPKTGKFDEHKIVLGADSEADAQAIYHANYEQGWQGMGAITPMAIGEFKDWIKSGKTKKPIAYTEPKEIRTASRTPKTASSLLQAIVNRGGISREIMQDVGGDPAGRYMPGLFTKTGTTDLSALASYLFDEDGFHQIRQDSDIGPARELEDLITRALGGEKILSTAAMEKGMQAEETAKLKEKAQRLGVKTVARKLEDIAADVLRIEAQNVLDEETRLEEELLPAYNETVDALHAAIGEDAAENFLEDLASKYQDETHLNYLRGATADIQEKINEQAISATEKPAEAAGRAAAEGDGTGVAPGGDRASGEEARPALTLSSQSEAELAARDRAAQAAEAQRLKDEQAAEDKRQADAERGSFQLTGSDRPADVLAAQGQGGLFDAPAPVVDKYAEIDKGFAENREAMKSLKVGDRVSYIARGTYTQADGTKLIDPVRTGKITKVQDKEQGIFEIDGNISHGARFLTKIDDQDKQPPAVDDGFADTPRIRQLRQKAAEIEVGLPPVADGMTRLWRGNRPGEVGKNPQFTNSLIGIALPFSEGYGGPISFVDVSTADLPKYVQTGVVADGAEFLLPANIASKAIAVGDDGVATIQGGAAADARKVGDVVKLTKPGVNGRVNIAGTVTKILPDGRLEVRTQQDGYMIVAESELGHKQKVGAGETASRDQGLHYASGVADFKAGKPRELPSYFTTATGKNPRDWYRGWDEAKAAAQPDASIAGKPVSEMSDGMLNQIAKSSQPAAEKAKAEVAKRKKPKADPLAAVREFYTPGNIIHVDYWNQYDKVLEFKEGDLPGQWNVKVQQVKKDGDQWVPKDDRMEPPSWHATAPGKDKIVDHVAMPTEQDRDSFTLERLNGDAMEPVTFERGEYVRYTLSGKDQFGDIDGISHARREFSVDGLWYPFGFAYKAERPAPAKPKDTVPLSSVVEAANKKHGEGLTDADRVPAQDQARRENPNIKTTLAEHDATVDRLRDGTATLAEYKAAFQRLQNSTEELTAEFAAMKKDDILKHMGGMAASRYKSDTKAQVVAMAVRDLMDDFSIGRGISYTMGGRDAYANAVRAQVERTTDADLAEYAEHVRSMRAAQTERVAQMTAAMKDPKTLDDFEMYLRAKMAEGDMTLGAARMTMTPEQRVAFDELAAEKSRAERKARGDQQRTDIRVAATTTDGQVIETKHTKTGEPLFVVKAAERVERDVYNHWNATAKKLGGWYSSYRAAGAVPGFQFKTRENADAFLAFIGGNAEQAKEAVQTRRDAFEDDRSQTAVERLTEMADRLEERADESLNLDRKENTDRRARMAANAEAAANSDKALAKTMRNIAQAIESGKTKFLDRVRQKAQVEMLRGFLHTAKANELRAKFPNYGDQEKHRSAPPTAETADYVDFPRYTAFRSDLATMGRQMLDIDGAKKVGAALLKVADDVSNAYLAFAKEHLHQVSTFKKKDSAPAIFASKDDAETAIKRSGFKGKAVVLPFKRGQNIIIMSPSAAQEAGIWKGDDDKRITLSPDFGEEVVAKVKEFSSHRISMPYLFENVRAERARLKAIGIETPAELRAALREFMDLRAAPPEVDKIKQMERAMIGRKNDGLDFFPTPASVADELVQAADVKEGMSVLEPSAGWGHIAERIRAAGVDPDVVEMAVDRRELLEAKGFRLVGSDFMDMNPRGFTYGDVFRDKDGVEGIMSGSGGMGSNRVGFIPLGKDARQSEWRDRDELTGVRKSGYNSGYDRIIMNPPFSDRRDAEHVQHAYTLLKPGGRLVAIMGEGVFFGQDKKAQAFRNWLDEVGGTSEKLEDGTFLDPSLPVNTGVNARMVVVDKPEGGMESRATTKSTKAVDTESAEFKRWFGKSAVVDADGKPLRAYHGTKADFSKFSSAKFSDEAMFFFSDSSEHAEIYAGEDAEDGGQVMPVFLSMKNPYYIDSMAWNLGDVPSEAALRKLGHDGLVIENQEGGTTYAVFKPTQIKSATSNTGAFSATNPNILESRGNPTNPVTTESTHAIQSVVDKFRKQFAGAAALNIRVVRTVADIPARFRPSPFAEGVFHDDAGLIYLITMNLKHANGQINTGRAWQVLMHEAVGHFGLAQMMGDRFKGVLKEVMRAARAKGAVEEDIYAPGHPDYATVEAVRLRYPEASDEEVAQEVLARMAETDPGRTLFGYVRAVVRQWLRDMARAAGVAIDVTTAELHDLLAQASAYMRRGDNLGAETMPSGTVAASRSAVAPASAFGAVDTASAAFKRWFGGSKITRADGKPLVLYHGTGKDFTVFRSGKQDGGIFLSPSPSFAGSFAATSPEKIADAQPNVLPVYVRAERVFDYENRQDIIRFDQAMRANGMLPEKASLLAQDVATGNWDILEEDPRVRAYLKAQGFDGVWIKELGIKNLMVRDPVQIKSATSNTGRFDPENPSILESRRAAGAQPQEPRTGILDTILRKAGGELAAKITGPAYDKLMAFLGGKMPEGIKAGLVSDYGLNESYVDRRTGMQTAQQKAARQTKTFVEGLMTLDRAQSRVAYQWLNNRGAEADRLMAQLPPESQQVLKDIKIQIAKLTIEAVRLGQLDAETAERNFLAYLHRSYAKYDLNTDDKTWKAERAKAIKILGDQYKGRGLKMDVDPDRIHSAPGWWQDEMKGKRVQVLKNEAGRFAFVAEGTAIPPNLSGYKVEGVWEIRARKAADRITLWRDFTQDERTMMGELDEAKYAVARTLFMMNRDIEVGRFHEWVADEYAKTPEEAEDEGLQMADASDSMMRAFTPDEWVTVPTAKIPGTNVFKFGALAGMVVPGPIWNDVRQISAGRFEPFGAAYASILRAWKLSKTALTPTTHVNNIMGNFVMADMHDVGARDAIAAVRLMVAAANGDMDAKALLDRYEDSGATQGMFTTHELRKEVLEPLLQQLREEVGMADDEAAILKVSAIMSLALHGQFGEAWAGAKAAAKQSTAGRVTGAVVTKAQDYYQAEDSVFRLAAFLKSIDEGKTDQEAGKLARKAFLDYHINAPWINAMRGTAMPFIAFAYRAIPMLTETAARKPWKIAKYMLVAGGLNALAYAMLGADGDEDKERAYLPDEKAGRLWGIVPKLVRMPWNRESKLRDGRTTSDPVFLDVRRWIPVGDVVDYGQDKTALPMIPQPLMPGGPLIIAAEFLVNKSAFTGKDLTKETDTWVEKAAKVGGHFYKSFAPNVPIPYSGTWAGTKIDNAVKGKEDPLGRAYPVPEAIASGFGLKLERYPVDTLQRNAVLDMKGKLKELGDEQRQAARDYGRQGMTKRELDEKVAEIVGKKNAAVEEYKGKERKAMGRPTP